MFIHPCSGEKTSESGLTSGQYFHQDLFVARRIFQRNQKRRADVGSRVDGFIAHVAVFRPIDAFDIRSQSAKVENIIFHQLDIMSPSLPSEFVACCDSLSCLHALEHFGLGRYGDTVNRDGHIDARRNLSAMLEPDGIFFSVPIGDERIEFNAHRLLDSTTIIDLTKENFELVDCSFLDDAGFLDETVDLHQLRVSNNFGCHYGCGIFELKKKASLGDSNYGEWGT